MTREDIIRMAREAHLDVYGLGKSYETFASALERFAALVAAAEREECAQICEVIRGKDMQPAWDTAAAHCAAAIRARREQ